MSDAFPRSNFAEFSPLPGETVTAPNEVWHLVAYVGENLAGFGAWHPNETAVAPLAEEAPDGVRCVPVRYVRADLAEKKVAELEARIAKLEAGTRSVADELERALPAEEWAESMRRLREERDHYRDRALAYGMLAEKSALSESTHRPPRIRGVDYPCESCRKLVSPSSKRTRRGRPM